MANIRGLNIDNFTKNQALQKIGDFLCDGRQHWIATINPEIAVRAYKDEKYRDILNKADLRVADGIGIILASRFLGEKLRERIVGVDLVYDILADLNHRFLRRIPDTAVPSYPGYGEYGEENGGNSRVMIIGAEKDSREKAMKNLKKLFPYVELGISLLKIKFNRENNGETDLAYWQAGKNNKENREMLAELNGEIRKFAPDILFVAFGAPRQEQWICDNLPLLPSVKLAIGVGGAIDMISGKLPRAPKIIRKMGAEWLWRFCLEPRRAKRIFNAVAVFPFIVFTEVLFCARKP
ncbi:MAG: WecB/TagA/CpsF family glycosyltransferase [Patescibacteria group bacterium]